MGYSYNYFRAKKTQIYHSNLNLFFCRSKSRSVDHGFATPFDWDSSKNKVDQGRFESVDEFAKGE